MPSRNFGKKKKTCLTNKITVRSLKISSPALDIHPFCPKLIMMMSTFEVCGRNHVVWLFKWNLFSFWVCDQSHESFWAVLFCGIGCSVLVYWLNCSNFGNCKQNAVVWPVWLFLVSEQTLSVVIQTKHFWHQLFVTVLVLILSLWSKSFGVTI